MKNSIRVLILSLLCGGVHGQWIKDPNLNNSISTDPATGGRIVTVNDGNGGAIIFFTKKNDAITYFYDIYAQKIDANGVLAWGGGVLVNKTNMQTEQFFATEDGMGGAIVVWQSDSQTANGSYDLAAQKIDSQGKVKWSSGGISVCNAQGLQVPTAIVSDGKGGAVVTWWDARKASPGGYGGGNSNNFDIDVFAQYLDSNGNASWQANGIAICNEGHQQDEIIVKKSGANYFFVWNDRRNNVSPDNSAVNTNLYGQLLNEQGAALWQANGVQLTTHFGFVLPLGLVADNTAGVVLFWSKMASQGGNYYYAQRLDSSGKKQWGATDLSLNATPVNGFSHCQTQNGGIGYSLIDLKAETISISKLGLSGSILWKADPIAVTNARGASLLSINNGQTLVAWADFEGDNPNNLPTYLLDFNLSAQMFSQTGLPLWNEGIPVCTAPGSQTGAQLVPDKNGGAIVAWVDKRDFVNNPAPAGHNEVYASHIFSSGSLGMKVDPDQLTTDYSVSWLKGYNESADKNIGLSGSGATRIATDRQGNVFVAGSYSGQFSVGNFTLTNTTPLGVSHAYLGKFNSKGDPIWIKDLYLLADGFSRIKAITVSAQGDVFIVGESPYSDLNNVFEPLRTFIYRFSSDGTIVWSDEMPSQPIAITDITLGSNDDLLMMGYYFNTYNVSKVSIGNDILPSIPSNSIGGNYFLAKADRQGQLSLISVGDGTAYGYFFNKMARDNKTGEIYFSGLMDSSDPATGSIVLYLAKLSSTGQMLWQNNFDMHYNGGDIGVAGIEVDNNGDLYLSGTFSTVLKLKAPNNTTHMVAAYGGYGLDAFIAKFNSNGENLWIKHEGVENNSQDYGTSLALDKDGNVWAGYEFDGPSQIGDVIVNGFNMKTLVKYDPSGNVKEIIPIIGLADLNSIATDSNNILFAGTFNGNKMYCLDKTLNISTPYYEAYYGRLIPPGAKPVNEIAIYTSNSINKKNNVTSVPVKVNQFRSILSGQFSLSWNPTVAEFVGVEQFGLKGLDDTSFGFTKTNQGSISFSWSADKLQPVTLNDSTTLFAVKFRLVGNYGDTTHLNVTNKPLAVEFIDDAYLPILYATQGGIIKIDDEAQISGQVKYTDLEVVQNVLIGISGGISKVITTDVQGKYSTNVSPGMNYTLTPSKINDPDVLNGIDVQDIASIRRHLLGVQTLVTPYQIIAGDVNQNDILSTQDLLLIQALILGVKPSFPNNVQWTFTPSDEIFKDNLNPFPYSRSKTINVDATPVNDFIAMKLGDVSNSRDNDQSGRMASVQAVTFDIHQEMIVSEDASGSVIDIPIRTKDFKDVAAFQFTIKWDPDKLQYNGTTSQQTKSLSFGENKSDQGLLSVLWDEPSGKSTTWSDKDELFSLRFITKTGGYRDIQITDEVTPIRVFDSDLRQINTSVAWSELDKDEYSTRTSIYPNPFREKLTLEYYLESAVDVQIEVMNAMGIPVSNTTTSGVAGKNLYHWSGTDDKGLVLPSGVYVVSLRGGGHLVRSKVVKY